METVRRAVIDVGTNSVKLLVADVCGEAQPVHEESRQTRLGRDFYRNHLLQPDAIAATARTVANFGRTAREMRAATVRVIATSAARDARNAGDLLSAIQEASGLALEIISGRQEAEWAFRGVGMDSAAMLLLDVGGGSTEFIMGRAGKAKFAESYPLGTVRCMEQFPQSDPPLMEELLRTWAWVRHFLKDRVQQTLEPALQQEKKTSVVRLVGTGGTAAILARIELKLDHYDRALIEGARLSMEQIRSQRKRLWALPLAQRREIPGLPASRADVMLYGILIYELVMEEFGFAELRVSTRGIRFGALMTDT
ncbi:MAG: hypothetical protein KGJ88_00100 [Verrucomicrobiota bacterium]|nr:hypothetical protein [Verrucomicrobiota bacterium]